MPLTNLTPKISDEGKEVDILTAISGEVEGASTSSSACLLLIQPPLSGIPVPNVHLAQKRRQLEASRKLP